MYSNSIWQRWPRSNALRTNPRRICLTLSIAPGAPRLRALFTRLAFATLANRRRRIWRPFSALDALMRATYDELREAGDVGPVIAASIRQFFAQPRHIEAMKQLRAAGVHWPERERENTKEAEKPLTGKIIALTGALPTLTREQAKEKLMTAGAKVSASVSRKTACVVAGADAGKKLTQAEALGLPVLDEEGLHQLLNGQIKL